MYHVTYQKGERVLSSSDPETLVKTKYHRPLVALAQAIDVPLPLSLQGMHESLVRAGHGLDYLRLARYSQNEFRQDIKSVFYAGLARSLPGELNLFVLRSKAVRKGYKSMILDELAKHYEIITVKDVPWLKRWAIGRRMRGNKWRWGGRPAVAVVVFDPNPIARTEMELREKHPLVFNARQFFKGELRERIIKLAGFYHKVNALHSTDNEAEAIGHMQLFFSPEEEIAIYREAGRLSTA
jgi:hypothetical protein